MRVSKYRDVTLLQIDESRYFTIACDSCGGIGMSELDIVKVEESLVGYLTTRVCLFETLAFRAKPTLLINTLCVEMEGRGKRILTGIKQAIKEYNEVQFFNEALDIDITGSTEENIPTLQTALGITVMGEIYHPFERPLVNKGDVVILIGYPKVGQEVLIDINENLNEIVSFQSLKQLTVLQGVKDILPVGSQGVKYELKQLSKTHNKDIQINENETALLEKSAGPATCVIAVVDRNHIQNVHDCISQQITQLGEII